MSDSDGIITAKDYVLFAKREAEHMRRLRVLNAATMAEEIRIQDSAAIEEVIVRLPVNEDRTPPADDDSENEANEEDTLKENKSEAENEEKFENVKEEKDEQ